MNLYSNDTRRLLDHWWGARNTVCKDPGIYGNVSATAVGMHARAWWSGDQTGLSWYALPQLPMGQYILAPHLMQGHTGSLFTHFYGKKSAQTTSRMGETLGRHAAGIAALVCDKNAGPCTNPRRIAAGAAPECTARPAPSWAAAWVHALLGDAAGVIDELMFSWPAWELATKACVAKMERVSAMWHRMEMNIPEGGRLKMRARTRGRR